MCLYIHSFKHLRGVDFRPVLVFKLHLVFVLFFVEIYFDGFYDDRRVQSVRLVWLSWLCFWERSD